MNIVLMGMKHCGKTSVGKKLAEDFDIPFFDLDDLIIARYEKEYEIKKGVEDIFREEGAGIFYRIEASTFHEFCRHEADLHEEFILSLGGRTPLNPLLGESLAQCGYLIYIKTPLENIRERILKRGTSTLIHGENPGETLAELYSQRHPVYEKLAHYIIDGSGDIQTVSKRITGKLEEFKNGRK